MKNYTNLTPFKFYSTKKGKICTILNLWGVNLSSNIGYPTFQNWIKI